MIQSQTSQPATQTLPASNVVPFPVRPRQQDRRLDVALSRLAQSMAAQRSAVDKWQSALGDLRASVKRLEGSMLDFQAKLAPLAGDAAVLQSQARKLEAWAGSVATA